MKCVNSTRWFKYDRDDLCVKKSQFVSVIFEPPCVRWSTVKLSLWLITRQAVRAHGGRGVVQVAKRVLSSGIRVWPAWRPHRFLAEERSPVPIGQKNDSAPEPVWTLLTNRMSLPRGTLRFQGRRVRSPTAMLSHLACLHGTRLRLLTLHTENSDR
jgi:hypothetical protein